MSSRKRFESGFVGIKNARNNDTGIEEVYAGDGVNDPSGFLGIPGNKSGNKITGFEGLDQQNKGNSNDFASLDFGRNTEQKNNPLFQNNKPPTPQKRKPFVPPKPTEKPLTHLDKETVGKVVELKDKFQKLKDNTKEKERELAVLDK